MTTTGYTPKPSAGAAQALSSLRMAQYTLDMAGFSHLEGAMVVRNAALLAARDAGASSADLEEATHLSPAEIELAVARAELAPAAGVEPAL